MFRSFTYYVTFILTMSKSHHTTTGEGMSTPQTLPILANADFTTFSNLPNGFTYPLRAATVGTQKVKRRLNKAK